MHDIYSIYNQHMESYMEYNQHIWVNYNDLTATSLDAAPSDEPPRQLEFHASDLTKLTELQKQLSEATRCGW